MIKKVAVIGAGTMGNGIAHVFAQFGYEVSLVDISEDSLKRGMATIEKNLDRMVAKEKITPDEKAATLGRLKTFTGMEEGVGQADLIVEAATENETLKFKIFEQLDKAAKPEAILATNTSSISITKIAAVTSRPDKVIGMHFMNPVPVRSEEHTSELQSRPHLVCRLLLEKKKIDPARRLCAVC